MRIAVADLERLLSIPDVLGGNPAFRAAATAGVPHRPKPGARSRSGLAAGVPATRSRAGGAGRSTPHAHFVQQPPDDAVGTEVLLRQSAGGGAVGGVVAGDALRPCRRLVGRAEG